MEDSLYLRLLDPSCVTPRGIFTNHESLEYRISELEGPINRLYHSSVRVVGFLGGRKTVEAEAALAIEDFQKRLGLSL